jgi:hypothetical protein
MTFWTDVACFCFAALVIPLTLLSLWAFIHPHGKISERLHPSSLGDRVLVTRQIQLLELLVAQGESVPEERLDPFGDVELITTVRRSPRRRRADNIIGGPQEPGP